MKERDLQTMVRFTLQVLPSTQSCLTCSDSTRLLFIQLSPHCRSHQRGTLCLFCGLHFVGHRKPFHRPLRLSPLTLVEYGQARPLLSKLENMTSPSTRSSRVELNILAQSGNPQVVRQIGKWLRVKVIEQLPDPRPEDRKMWRKIEAMRSGLLVRTLTPGHALMVLRYPFAEETQEAFERVLERYETVLNWDLRLIGLGEDAFIESFAERYDELRRSITFYAGESRRLTGSMGADRPTPNRLVVDTSLDEAVKLRSWGEVFRLLLLRAYQAGASDFHIEVSPALEQKDGGHHPITRVLWRIDGRLHEVKTFTSDEAWQEMINVIKAHAGFQPSRAQQALDGSFSLVVQSPRGEETIFCRVNILPTRFYEACVIRILKRDVINKPLDVLGLTGRAFETLQQGVDKRDWGLVVLSGPTGSGKSTTLHVLIRSLMERYPDRKFLSVEDPVEYQQSRMVQIEVTDKFGFADAVSSFMRHDPDVILVGEIRDINTAQVTMQLSLTGHLVLTTIHSATISDILTRFDAFGLDPFMVRTNLLVLAGQRLVREPCSECVTLVPAEKMLGRDIYQRLVEGGFDVPSHFHVGVGCNDCRGEGRRSRIAVLEVAPVGPALWDVMTARDYRIESVLSAARADGMVTFIEDTLEKAAKGRVDGREVVRILGGCGPLLSWISRKERAIRMESMS